MSKDWDWNGYQVWDQVGIWTGVGVRVGAEIRIRTGKTLGWACPGADSPATSPQHPVLQPGAGRAPGGRAAAAGGDGRGVPRRRRAARGAGRVRPPQRHPLRHRREGPASHPHHPCLPLELLLTPRPSLRCWGITCGASRILRISSGRSNSSPAILMRNISSMSRMRPPSTTSWTLWEIGSSAWKVLLGGWGVGRAGSTAGGA